MLTVITETTVRPGHEEEWDAAFHERANDARQQDGWVALHLLAPMADDSRRIVVGTWKNHDAWKRWHATETFQRTRDRLDAATDVHGEDTWFRVIEEKTSN